MELDDFPRASHGAATLSEPVEGESLFTRTKTLLNDISGKAREGEVLAVLGASGPGKSTLIDALGGTPTPPPPSNSNYASM
ncbi:hypothetical protein ABKV19_009366 [Rosa sericea]